MKMLRPCPSCARHVRVAEACCPFCEAALDTTGPLAAKAVPPARLGRAALLAFGAAAAAATLGACGSGTGPITGVDASASDGGGGSDARDGSVPPDDANIAKPYGAPPADGLLELV